jgi:DNA modification methylase
MIQLLHGDCLELMKQLPDQSIDMVITSPPYDDLRTYEDTSSFSFKETARLLTSLLKPGGVIVWNVGDQCVNGSETGTSFRQALYFVDECRLNLHDTMIWQKSNFSNPSTTRYHQVFEYVFILSKGKPKTFNPIKDRKNVSSGNIGSFGENTVTQKNGTKKVRPKKIVEEYGMRHNVWITNTAGQEQTAKKYGHPAMFSESFANDHIISWSNEGDLLLDPFMGSGTSGAVAKKLGRSYIGMEVNETYYMIAKNRIEH